ncbi:TRAP transporter small permease protein [Rhodobacterales bacterium 52_120_T64]|nr:TRAP transporter small permease protein [Rhodobacterales bacterium 52_120_T64]
MADNDKSIWLGSKFRSFFKKFTWASGSIFAALIAWVIIGDMTIGLGVELRTLLHPTTNLSVMLMLIAGTATLFSTSIYLSDFKGDIEIKPEGIFDVFSLVWSRVAMIGIVAVVLVMFYEVVSRYIFEKPTLWANELSLWMAGFIFLLSGLYAMQQRCHIRIYVVYDLFPRWVQKTADTLSVFLLWVFTVSLIWGGYNESRDKWNRWETFGTAWDPPLPATIKPAILVIITLVAVQALSNLIADWHKAPESHTPMDDIDQTEIEHMRQSIKD